jgi:chitodextrinase
MVIIVGVVGLLTLTIFAFETNHSTHGFLGALQYTIQEVLDNRDNNNTTHPWLTIRAIEESGITSLSNTAKRLIVQGSIEEDIGIAGTATGYDEYGFASTSWEQWNYIDPTPTSPNQMYSSIPLPGYKLLYRRAENHFLPALPPRTTLGTTVVSTNVVPATTWAYDSPLNLRDWTDGINASSDEVKWKSLGHVLHLIEDMGIPAHTRKDIHAYPDRDVFEHWAGNELTFFEEGTPTFTDFYRPVKTGLLNITPSLNGLTSTSFSSLTQAMTELRDYVATNYITPDTAFISDYATAPVIPNVSLYVDTNKIVYSLPNNRRIGRFGYAALKKAFNAIDDAFRADAVDPETGKIKPGYVFIDDDTCAAMWQDIAPKVVAVAAKVIKLYYDTFNDTTAPSVPTGLIASAASSSQINLSWSGSTDNVGVTGYKVYRNGVLTATLSAVTSYSDVGLTGSITYTYTVRAYDAANNLSLNSNSVSATTPAAVDTTAPSVPAGLVVSYTSPTTMALFWNDSTDTGGSGMAGYNIYRYGTFISNRSYTITTYNDTGLAPATEYGYSVSAYDGAGNTSAQSTVVSATTPADTSAPSVPSGLTGTAVSISQINLNWTGSTDNVGVAGYRVYNVPTGTLIASVFTTNYSDTGLTAGTAYSYRVSAYDAAGNTSGQSSSASGTTLANNNWQQVAGGGVHTVALRADGSLYAWGYNYDGQLGDGTNVTRTVPTLIGQ